MKYITLIALLLLNNQVLAATAQTNNVLNIGNSTQIDNPSLVLPVGDISKIVSLHAEVSGATAGNYYMLMKMNSPGAVGQYQVPVGKTFYALGFYVQIGAASNCVSFGYGTAALGSDNTASAPAGNVPYTASSAICGMRVTEASVNKFMSIPMSFPANSYPYVRLGNSTTYNIDVVGLEM